MDKSFVDLFNSFCCQSLLFSYGESSLEFFASDWFFFLFCDLDSFFPCVLLCDPLHSDWTPC